MNTQLISLSDFFQLRPTVCVLDVRSPNEFQQGHSIGAHNIPILTNSDRAIVGTTYKQQGSQQAIYKGFELVGPRLKEIVQETEKIAAGREVATYCWRGGMRSRYFCQFIGMAKIPSYQLKGGYKAYRQMALEYFKKPLKIVLLGGCTGSGKSDVLRALAAQGEQVLDLETIARHKGSAFGALMQPPQPTTEQFHNHLFEQLYSFNLSQRIWIEDESITIGQVFLPPDLWTTMKLSPILQMDVSKEIRIDRLAHEYGHADKQAFMEAIDKIKKRLGGQHHQAAKEKWLANDVASTIDILLTYYDKYYMSSLTNKQERIQSVLPWNGKDVEEYAKYILSQANSSSTCG